MMKRRALTEFIGWYGFAAVLTAYATSNLGWLTFGSATYQALNLTGAVALLIDAWPDRNWQIVALNTVWAGVAIFSLLR